MPIRLYIVDDHKIFRDVIISLVSHEKDIKVIGSAGSVQGFMDDIPNHQPDVILMDIQLKDGDGTKAVSWYKEKNTQGKVLIFSTHREEKYIKKVVDCGANGYLLKDAGSDVMMKAIRTIHKGESYYCNEIMNLIIKQLTQRNAVKKIKTDEKLTPREIEVLKLIVEENSNQEIADMLFISIRTVTTHRTHLLEKLEAKNTAGLVKYALKKGIVKL